ncbi:hypothetical protein Pla163_11290 [Planctomycetes bacterium Pla163]|uniref:Uncharacterized protein n=1 Tax=Rohdeia mirabilis TaxID=2528008 RepID=A0A518CXT8_9BACT|nr:hypothetical protein Pla163_11290 [Planctomycetes bacterium Pla163]
MPCGRSRLRGTEEIEAERVGVADPLLLLSRLDPLGFLLKRAEAWALGRAAAAGGALETWSRRPVPDEEGPHGLVATLVGLAVDAPRLVERIEATTRWHDLEGAVDEAQAYAEEVAVLGMGEGG